MEMHLRKEDEEDFECILKAIKSTSFLASHDRTVCSTMHHYPSPQKTFSTIRC